MTSLPILAMIGGIGTAELVVIAIIALLLFGHKLPQVMRSLGRGVTEFKKGVRGIEDDLEKASIPPPSLPEAKSQDSATAPDLSKTKL